MRIIDELGKYEQKFGQLFMTEGELSINDDSDSDGKLEDFTEAGFAIEKGFTVDDADPEELKVGIKIEMEHTSNPKFAERIALDHLAEIPDYYTRLVAMEKQAGVEK